MDVEKLGINKLTNVATSLNNSKTVPVDLKKLSDVVDNEIVKNTKFNTLKTKVNNLAKEIPRATDLINIIQYNTYKQNLENKIGDFDKKIPDRSGLVTTTLLNIKISKVENKIPDYCKYITTPEFNKLKEENLAARLKQASLVNKTNFDNKLRSFNRQITSNKTTHLEV